MTATEGSITSYGFTPHVKKIMRSDNPGQSNKAMSYAFPPTEDELNRNAERWRHNRNYDEPSKTQYPNPAIKKQMRTKKVPIIDKEKEKALLTQQYLESTREAEKNRQKNL
jgi:hypothetical protein